MSLEKLLAHDKHVRYLCQDETRLGMKTLSGKAITAPGVTFRYITRFFSADLLISLVRITYQNPFLAKYKSVPTSSKKQAKKKLHT